MVRDRRSGPAPQLLSLIVCPRCHGEVEWSSADVACTACGATYEIIEGIPVFADPAADRGPRAEHKRRQIEHFEGARAEFEIERPHGATRLYRWLIDEKHRRALSGIESMLPGATALTVCGGSGMDGEYLASAGAAVIVSDISLGVALRARERAHRYGLDFVAIVADAECLPFCDAAVDVVFVHDGLHHLADPLVGVDEMTRVAKRAVSITEPAQAVATRIAVRLGLATNREHAGNPVERLDSGQVVEHLNAAGFDELCVERYAMYYRHCPGSVSRALSRRVPLLAVKLLSRAFNRVAGGIGNKLAVVAVREGVVAPLPRDRSAGETNGSVGRRLDQTPALE